MLYQREFGSSFNLDFDLSELSFLTDRSWRQDMSPSFYFNIDNYYFVLWVDFELSEQREEDNARYIVQQATNEGSVTEPETSADGENIFSCESSYEITIFLNRMMSESEHGS